MADVQADIKEEQPAPEELITKPKKEKRKLEGEEKAKFLERMRQGREKKKTVVVDTTEEEQTDDFSNPSVDDLQTPAVKPFLKTARKPRVNQTLQKLEELEKSNGELLSFVREYKEKKEAKPTKSVGHPKDDLPKGKPSSNSLEFDKVSLNLKPEDVYQNRVNQIKNNYLNKQVYMSLFGES